MNKKHKVSLGLAIFLTLIVLGIYPLTDARSETKLVTDDDSVTRARAEDLYGKDKLPLLFIPNQGQIDSNVAYYASATGRTLYFTDEGVIFDLGRRQETRDSAGAEGNAERLVFSLSFVDANQKPTVEGIDRAVARVNYFIGNDPDKWHTDLPTYREIVYHELYPNVDLKFYGKQGPLSYDFIINPGGDITDIMLAYRGAQRVTIEDGELVVETAFGGLRQSPPNIYQEIADSKVKLQGGFRLISGNTCGFLVDSYNPDYPLVIDPVLTLEYSTYLGGSGYEAGASIAVDAEGRAYITGTTNSTDFPTGNPYQGVCGGTQDIFVTKLSVSGTLVYSTYLGGGGLDYGRGIAVDALGCVYIAGGTESTNFPTQNPYQGALNGTRDAFVTKLSASGNTLVYSTYVGGGDTDVSNAIDIDVNGNAYITGVTGSSDFPTQNPYQGTRHGYEDAFVTKLSASGNSLVYSTYLGGDSNDEGQGIAVDIGECAYINGNTESTNFPTQNPYQGALHGPKDAFITKLSTSGNSLVYSTYIGGGGSDETYGISVDTAGSAYITGVTMSTDFPTQDPYQGINRGLGDAFITKLSASGNTLVYSTYVGGSNYDPGGRIAVDAQGCAYVIGWTQSTDFPTQNPFQETYQGGRSDAFVLKLSAPGNTLVYSTYLGGSDYEEGRGITVDAKDCAYVTGVTGSTNFPTENPYQGVFQGAADAFITKICYVPLIRPLEPLYPLPPLVRVLRPSPVTPLLPVRELLPANFNLQYLSVRPQQAYAAQPVTISTNVVNTGGETGNYNAVLKINGQVNQSRMVSVGPGSAYPIKFTVTESKPGTYTIDIGGKQSSFIIIGAEHSSVGSPKSAGLIAILIVSALVIVTAAALALTYRRPA